MYNCQRNTCAGNLEKDPGYVMDVLRQGTEAAQAAAADTLAKVKHAMQIDYFA